MSTVVRAGFLLRRSSATFHVDDSEAVRSVILKSGDVKLNPNPTVSHRFLYRPFENLTAGFRVLDTLDFPAFGHFHDVTYFLRLYCVVNDMVYYVWIMMMTPTFPSVHFCES
jgi:hypothetical protein